MCQRPEVRGQEQLLEGDLDRALGAQGPPGQSREGLGRGEWKGRDGRRVPGLLLPGCSPHLGALLSVFHTMSTICSGLMSPSPAGARSQAVPTWAVAEAAPSSLTVFSSLSLASQASSTNPLSQGAGPPLTQITTATTPAVTRVRRRGESRPGKEGGKTAGRCGTWEGKQD